MTKKEAVEILRHADTDSEVDADDYLEAFDMAVSALESESNRDDLTEVVMRYIETFHPDFLKREEHQIYPGHNKDDKVVVIGGRGSHGKRTLVEQMLLASCARCWKKALGYCQKEIIPQICEDFQPME